MGGRRHASAGATKCLFSLQMAKAFFGNRSAQKRKRATRWVTLFMSMARPEGFEPPTFWFVARRSIQLSYGRVIIFRSNKLAEREGFEPSKGF
jgi:hypothetical protein